jgi:DNA-binding beta-propeller fold protein YncE
LTRLLLALAGLLVAAPAASAATPGALSELPGPGGCVLQVSDSGSSGTCNPGGAISDGNAIALSPDGQNVYVTSSDDNAVVAIARDPSTGTIQQLDGAAGCIQSMVVLPAGRACTPGRRLQGANGVAVSDDGRFVYASTNFDKSVAILTRDTGTGALTQPADPTGCVARVAPDCTTDARVAAMFDIVLSSDGRFAYTAGSDRVLAFARDGATGALAPLVSRGCVAARARPGCAAGHGLRGAIALALSPDGRTLYVASFGSNAVTALNVNAGTGSLSQASGRRGCWTGSKKRSNECTLVRGISDASNVTVSPDARNVYVTSTSPSGLAVFKRKSDGGLSQLAGKRGCFGPKGCAKAVGLDGARSVAVSPDDGRNVYLTTDFSDAVLSFTRGKGGALTQLRPPAGCIVDQQDHSKGCASAARALLDNPEAVTLTPDGHFVYVAEGGVDAFLRAG